MRRFRSVAVPAVTLAVMLGGTVGYGRLAPAAGTAAGTALSARAFLAIQHYLVQVGAAAAWRAGDTGTGVKVAVLDTGVDASHPDLRRQIVAERNFSGSPA